MGLQSSKRSRKMLNILIVYAHQLQHKSFNGALKDTAVEMLRKQGHNVVVSDLYSQKFNPVASKVDIGRTDDMQTEEEYYSYVFEMGRVYGENKLPQDIAEEIEKVKAADLIIFQFPMHWSTVPAILKGWFDRVLVYGFAFTAENNFEKGLLKGKKAMLSFTTSQPKETYRAHSQTEANLDAWFWPIHYVTLRFCGMDVLPAHGHHNVYTSQEVREELLQKWRKRLDTLVNEKPIKFKPIHK